MIVQYCVQSSQCYQMNYGWGVYVCDTNVKQVNHAWLTLEHIFIYLGDLEIAKPPEEMVVGLKRNMKSQSTNLKMSQLTNEGNTGPDDASFSLNLEDSFKKVIIGLWTLDCLTSYENSMNCWHA